MIRVTGTAIQYYFLCHRKLWFFGKKIEMEHTSDRVAFGKVISETTYEREKHEIAISTEDGDIVLDFFDEKNKKIHEVKTSDKMEDIHSWQVKYYILVLEEKGIAGVTGEIDYPKLKQKVQISLSDEDRKELAKIKGFIKEIEMLEKPPGVIDKPFCKQCSYYDLCYI